MNHVSSKWLRRLRWLFLLYSSHFLIIYLYIGIRYSEWHGTTKFPFVIVTMVCLQVVYEAYSSFRLVKSRTYLATVVSAFFMLLETGVIQNPSGIYFSPYMIPIIIMCFLGSAVGWFIPLIVVTSFILLSMFGLAGFLKSPVPVNLKFYVYGSVEMILMVVLLIFGYFFWKKYYDLSENAELRRLTTRLKRGTQQSTAILNSIGDGVIVFTSSGIIDLINPPASAMTGYEIKDALGKDINSILKFSDPESKAANSPLPDYISIAIKEKKHLSETVKISTPRIQRNLIVLLGVSPIVIPPNNELVGGVVILHDVTKEIEIERQRNDFVSTASHEMRTPIATIEGYLDIALSDKEHELKPPLRDYIDNAHKSTIHLGKLFQDLLSSSSVEDGSMTNNPQVFDLKEFMDQLSEDYHLTTKKHGLTFIYKVAGEITKRNKNKTRYFSHSKYLVYADPIRLREVINNLFDNAVKYTQKGSVEMGLSSNNANVQIYVKDSGIGIPESDIPHLFQKFYRVDNSLTRTIGGTGLGLFICKKIVEMYGGSIWIESKYNEGSTFFVTLPRLTIQEAAQLKAKEAERKTQAETAQSKPDVTSEQEDKVKQAD